MVAFRRRQLLLGAVALSALSACGPGGTGGMAASPDDMAVGAENAPATLIEYASTTCPHCREFHEAVWEQLKANYIDTGKLRYIFREFPTPPPAVAVAGFQLARCGNANGDQYMTRIAELFRQQNAIFSSGSMEGVRLKFVEIGAAAGLSEDQVMACINDTQAASARITRFEEGSRAFGITGTPTLILNGTKLDQERDPSVVTYAGLSRLIDAAIAGRS